MIRENKYGIILEVLDFGEVSNCTENSSSKSGPLSLSYLKI